MDRPRTGAEKMSSASISPHLLLLLLLLFLPLLLLLLLALLVLLLQPRRGRRRRGERLVFRRRRLREAAAREDGQLHGQTEVVVGHVLAPVQRRASPGHLRVLSGQRGAPQAGAACWPGLPCLPDDDASLESSHLDGKELGAVALGAAPPGLLHEVCNLGRRHLHPLDRLAGHDHLRAPEAQGSGVEDERRRGASAREQGREVVG